MGDWKNYRWSDVILSNKQEGQMLHHVRHVARPVSVQAGRCERRLERNSWAGGFTTENLTEWWNPPKRSSNRCMCLCNCVHIYVCMCLWLRCLAFQVGLTGCRVWSQHHNKNRQRWEWKRSFTDDLSKVLSWQTYQRKIYFSIFKHLSRYKYRKCIKLKNIHLCITYTHAGSVGLHHWSFHE